MHSIGTCVGPWYMRSIGYANILSFSPHSTYVDVIWAYPADFTGDSMEVLDPATAVFSQATTNLRDDRWLL